MSHFLLRSSWRTPTRFLIVSLIVVVLCSLPRVAGAQDDTLAKLPLIDTRVEEFVKALTLYLARFVEGAAALVIGVAAVRALFRYFTVTFGPKKWRTSSSTDDVRLGLGRALALALEFELAADVLQTAVAPTWNEVGLLAAIAVLRTGLNYFLEKELRNAEARDTGTDANTDAITSPEGVSTKSAKSTKAVQTADQRRAG